MHSVIDVTGGVLAGISTAYFFTASSQAIDGWICGGGLQVPAIILFAHFCSIYFHITAIDNCPCYIDNTSAISVVSGVMFGYWQRAFVSDRDMHGSPRHYDIVFNYQSMGLSRALLRILVGLSVLFAWKICSKPLMIGLIERWRNLRCWLPAHPGYYNVPTDPAAVCKGQDLQYHQASDSGYATESSVT
ncbi:Long-chain base-1-phosphate phosphatase, partial [Spiromyces aspiralis]